MEWMKMKKSKFMILLFILVGLSWLVWTKVVYKEWITYTYPQNGDINVPLFDTITIQWKEREGERVSFRIEYVDIPSLPILGVTAGSKDGMSFMPEGLLPNKKIKVSVSSGWHSHSFVFTTATEADRMVDAYRAVLAYFFRSPSHGQPPEVVGLDVSTMKGWPQRDRNELIEGLSAAHSTIVYGMVKEGFQPIDKQMVVESGLNQDALLIRIDKRKEAFGTYELAIQLNRGKGVLKGAQGIQSTFVYSCTYENGKWQVNALSEDPIRPWVIH